MKLFHIVLVEDQTRNSNIPLSNQIVETLFSCYDDSPLHSVFHQVDIPISAQIICEGQKITIPVAILNTHWIAYIGMYYFQ